MKISSIAAIFVFGSSVTANPGSIRSERNDIEFDVSLTLCIMPLQGAFAK